VPDERRAPKGELASGLSSQPKRIWSSIPGALDEEDLGSVIAW
jgi:hypothetical protein